MVKKEIRIRVYGNWFVLDDRGIPDECDAVEIKETLTLKEFEKYFPKRYREIMSG